MPMPVSFDPHDGVASQPFGGHVDLSARWCVAAGVVQDVAEYLSQPHRIGIQIHRLGGHDHGQGVSEFLDQRSIHVGGFPDERSRRLRGCMRSSSLSRAIRPTSRRSSRSRAISPVWRSRISRAHLTSSVSAASGVLHQVHRASDRAPAGCAVRAPTSSGTRPCGGRRHGAHLRIVCARSDPPLAWRGCRADVPRAPMADVVRPVGRDHAQQLASSRKEWRRLDGADAKAGNAF